MEKIEEDVKELAIDIARKMHPFKVNTSDHKDAAWRQWEPVARHLIRLGWKKC